MGWVVGAAGVRGEPGCAAPGPGGAGAGDLRLPRGLELDRRALPALPLLATQLWADPSGLLLTRGRRAQKPSHRSAARVGAKAWKAEEAWRRRPPRHDELRDGVVSPRGPTAPRLKPEVQAPTVVWGSESAQCGKGWHRGPRKGAAAQTRPQPPLSLHPSGGQVASRSPRPPALQDQDSKAPRGSRDREGLRDPWSLSGQALVPGS